MVLEMIVINTDDGYTAEVPSIRGCESWAHEQAQAIDQTLDLVAYYLKLKAAHFALDLIRRTGKKTEYKIIFNK